MYKFTENEINDTIKFIENNRTENDNADILISYLKENGGVPEMNEIENRHAHEFYHNHKNCCKEKLGKEFFSTIGGAFSYLIHWCPSGFLYEYQCNSCKESEDITDYSKFGNETIDNKNCPFSFDITGTGLGNCIVVICNVNGNRIDVTDIDCW